MTDAEVYQEILHRYSAIARPEAIAPAFRLLEEITDTCYDVTRDAVGRAKELLESHPGISARDAVHLAVMAHNDVTELLSSDAGIDAIGSRTDPR